MMIEARALRLLQRSGATARALALTALALGPLGLAGPAAAQQPFDVTVYHAFDNETGADPRPTSSAPPGCQVTGAGAGTTTIHFDSLNNGDLVTNQFPGATFSSVPGQEVQVFPSDNPYGTSQPNFICAAFAGEGPNCNGDVIVDYSPPTENVSFIASADNLTGVAAVVDVYEDGVLSATVDIVTDNNAFTPHPVDLTAFSNVTRIHIRNIVDPGGLSLDDFVFGGTGGIDCVIKGGSNEEINLWINGGPASSGEATVCMLGEGGGSGDELCGADILFQLSGVGEFRRFERAPGMGLVYKPDCVVDEEAEQCLLPPGTTQIRMNFLRGLSSPGTGQQRLGTLVVDSTGLVEGTSTTVTAFGEAAGANLQPRPIASASAPEFVAISEIPEPGQLIQLVSGLLGLGCLYRLRQRP